MERVEQESEKLIEKARKLADSLGVSIYFQGDPRGPAIYIALKSDVPKLTQENYHTARTHALY